LNNIRTCTNARLQLFVGLCEKIGLPQIINEHMRKAIALTIPLGIEVMILMAPMVE
jgi:hypothetical protein